MFPKCFCRCHVGNVDATHIPPRLDEPVSTLTACSQCRMRHFPPPAWEPPVASADGYSYDPTGDCE